jgi:hypothetical protein
MERRFKVSGKLTVVVLFVCTFALPIYGRAQAQAAAQQPTWTDPSTGLMWTITDNGADVDWNQATSYCTNLRLGTC